jgi:energy-coupling factor transporter ATP-binding protein EcfA2
VRDQAAPPAQYRAHDYHFELTGDAELVERLSGLFADMAAAEPVDDPHEFAVERFEAHGRITFDGHDTRPWAALDLFGARTISMLTLEVITANTERLHLHAGAVVDDGRTILLVAPSGSGKSTVTTALVVAGAQYRTDELIAIDPDTFEIDSYPKPISIKAGGFDVVEDLTGQTAPTGVSAWELRAGRFGAVAPRGDHPATTVVFNTWQRDAPTSIEPLHRATAVRLMLSDSQDAIRFGPRSIHVAAAVVAGARCVRVTGGDAAATRQAILDAHRSPSDRGEFAIVDAPSATDGPRRAADVESVVVDGRVVLYTPAPHRLVELDEGPSAWWLLLEVRAAGEAVLDMLRTLGVVDEG